MRSVKGTELVAFAILAVVLILWMAWPSSRSRSRRAVPPRRPEGPSHPYRQAAAEPKRRADDLTEADDAFAGADPELIPSRIVEIATRTGRLAEAIAFLQAEAAARPDPDLAYLLARTLAAHEDLIGAEQWLLTAARLGQRDLERARTEPAFQKLRQRETWRTIETALGGDGPEPRG